MTHGKVSPPMDKEVRIAFRHCRWRPYSTQPVKW